MVNIIERERFALRETTIAKNNHGELVCKIIHANDIEHGRKPRENEWVGKLEMEMQNLCCYNNNDNNVLYVKDMLLADITIDDRIIACNISIATINWLKLRISWVIEKLWWTHDEQTAMKFQIFSVTSNLPHQRKFFELIFNQQVEFLHHHQSIDDIQSIGMKTMIECRDVVSRHLRFTQFIYFSMRFSN